MFFETEKNGFYGTYYENPNGADCAMIGLFGDDPNAYMPFVYEHPDECEATRKDVDRRLSSALHEWITT